MSANRNFIDQYLREMQDVIDIIDREKIDQIIDAMFNAWAKNKRMFLMGNGGSASTSSHLVNDLGKCTALPGKKRFKVLGLTDNSALITALVNDNGFENLYSEQLLNFVEDGDLLVGFSAHGGSGKDKAGLWSQNLLKAYQTAKDHGALTVGFSGYDGGVMKDLCDICVVVPIHNTQHVESLHLALGHLVCNRLIQKISESEPVTVSSAMSCATQTK
jgi:D-sedoheptulose 7-phosphate isomerase